MNQESMYRMLPRVQLHDLLGNGADTRRCIFDSFRSHSLIIVKLDEPNKDLIHNSFKSANSFFTECDEKTKDASRISSKVGYKMSAPKERYQFRRFGGGDFKMPTHPADFKCCMTEIYSLFEKIADICFDISLSGCSISTEDVLKYYGDPNPLGPTQWATSVFNVYRYFNTPETMSACNCIEHIDPGFMTVLARSPVVGLEVFESPDRWTRIEEFMEHDELLVIVGDTIERMTAKCPISLKGSLHRVGKSDAPRTNLIYELRPRKDIWWPWGSDEELAARHGKGTYNKVFKEAY